MGMVGETIGNYRIESLLGAGGMGEVYLAEQIELGTRVAIKVLQSQISKDAEHVQRFFNEARAVSKVRSAGTVKIFDCGFHKDQAFLVMEFLEGESLADRIRKQGTLATPVVLEICRQIAGVLDAVHAVGITHRDLKPDNIFLVPDHELASGERIKVLDFGIAKLTGTIGNHAPQTRGTMGTPAYMAPEQWNNAADVDGRADVYSLGCVMFEMACGRPPFPASSIGEACTHHLHTTPPRIRSLHSGVPVELDALVDRMLAKSPDGRPISKDVARALDELRGTRSSSPALAVTLPDTPTPVPGQLVAPIAVNRTTMPRGEMTMQSDRRRRWLLAIAAVLVVGAGVTVYLATRPSEPEIVAQPAPPPTPDASLAIDAAPIPTTPRDKLLAVNPFIDINGIRVLSRQVTLADYKLVMGKAPVGGTEDAPIGMLTQLEASAFCIVIDARLPTSDEWSQAAKDGWGIGSGVVVGPLMEWTSTFKSGQFVVRGGHSRMSIDSLARASKQSPPYSSLRPPGDGTAPRDAIADATIGFRCADGEPKLATAAPVQPPRPAFDITGKWYLRKEGEGSEVRAWVTFRRTGNRLIAVGDGWAAAGEFDGKKGYYSWEFADAKSGKTTLFVDDKGRLHGQVRGSGIDWDYIAARE
jgi:predicted Ser/Thr protein kinase